MCKSQLVRLSSSWILHCHELWYSSGLRCTRGVSGEQRQCWLRDVEPRMPKKGRTRQYQSHTLKLRHWLLEVKIHHFPRRGAACHPRPSCCSPGTRLCPLQRERDLEVRDHRAVPLQSLPRDPAQPVKGRAAKVLKKNSISPPNYLELL